MLSCCRGPGLHWERPQGTRVGSSCCGARRPRCVLTWPADVGQHYVTALAAVAGHVSDQGAFTGPQAILDRYRALLHEYRQHKAALADWLSHVTSTKHRQAQLLDAEATGDALLISRFQQYLMSRKRLLAEIPIMREQLEDAELQQHHNSSSHVQQHRWQHGRAKHSSARSTGSHGVVNANQASPISKSQAVGQFFAAANYRTQHRVREGSVGSSSETALPPAQHSPQLQPALEAEPSGRTASAPPAAAAAAVETSGSSSSSSGSSSSSSNRTEALSHLLSAASNSSSASSSSSSGSSGRAAAAALAALAYKKQSGSGAAGSSSSSSLGSRQQRPLAMQLAEGPPPPPGYAIGGTGLDGSSSSSSNNVVIGSVEIAKADANALRSNRQLETDVSLEATLQGVPGGLGASDAAMFAATITRSAAAADAAVNSSSSTADVTAAAVDPVLAAAAAKASSSGSNEPVGEVVTAKFDVYSGRQRVMEPDALDVYFASLAEGHSMQLAAAAAAVPSSSSSSSSSTMADSPAVQQQDKIMISSNSSSGKANQQKASRRQGVSSGSSESGSLVGGLGLPGDIIPLPT